MKRKAQRNLWAIVLAGGNGTRMCPLVERWLGYLRPKQYCTFYGSKSLLEYTIERASHLVSGERIVTVVGNGHRAHFPPSFQAGGRILEQPVARGTGPGVMLPLSYVRASDPDAVVVILPSDHFISPDGPFYKAIKQATDLLGHIDERIVLIGVPPSEPEPEYGWIRPGSSPCCKAALNVRRVYEFVEKPSAAEAQRLYSGGCLWNTMIAVTRVRTLWALVAALYPDAMGQFEQLCKTFEAIKNGWIAADTEPLILDKVYSNMVEFDFSRDIMARSVESCLILPLEDVVWSDLGRPERLAAILGETGYQPNFPPEFLREFEPLALHS